MIISERSYLNPLSVWGVRQHDPFGTEHLKSVHPHHVRRIDNEKVYFPEQPKSRFLSPNPSTYLT
jgi:hypothetical protein